MSVFSLGELIFTKVALVISIPVVRVSRLIEFMDDCTNPAVKIHFASPWVASKRRRFLDCAVAAASLLTLLPVLALCCVLVRFSSAGPVFFRQHRMGRDGKEFAFYKFRSMRTGCSRHAPSLTVQDDERITWAGKFLRRYKLDELPQFWNVLKGDMSLVGPRPKISHYEALHMAYRPGLTGEATLAFRDEERMLLGIPRGEVDRFYQSVIKPIKAELDIDYMERATFSSDMSILWRTFTSCIISPADPFKNLATLIEDHASKQEAAAGEVRQSDPATKGHTAMPFHMEIAGAKLAGDLDDAA